MAEQLLPCPFCGAQAQIREIEEIYFVTCKECTGGSGGSVDSLRVIESWNRREPDENLRRANDLLRDQLGKAQQRILQLEGEPNEVGY